LFIGELLKVIVQQTVVANPQDFHVMFLYTFDNVMLIVKTIDVIEIKCNNGIRNRNDLTGGKLWPVVVRFT